MRRFPCRAPAAERQGESEDGVGQFGAVRIRSKRIHGFERGGYTIWVTDVESDAHRNERGARDVEIH